MNNDELYQEFLDNIPRVENAHNVHKIIKQHFENDEEKKCEEERDDGVIIDWPCGVSNLNVISRRRF